MTGAHPAGGWLAAVATFLAFAGVSGYLGATGVTSCGCLGAVHASPWWAFAADVAALVLLAVGRPKAARGFARSSARGDEAATGPARGGLNWVGAVAVALIGLTAAGAARYGSPDAALARLRGDAVLVDSFLDLGTGKPGDHLEATATVRNVTDRPVRLVGGTSDCSCTVVNDLPVTIAPGEAAAVGIHLQVPSSDSGRLARAVFLRTDDPNQLTVRFTIGCRVE